MVWEKGLPVFQRVQIILHHVQLCARSNDHRLQATVSLNLFNIWKLVTDVLHKDEKLVFPALSLHQSHHLFLLVQQVNYLFLESPSFVIWLDYKSIIYQSSSDPFSICFFLFDPKVKELLTAVYICIQHLFALLLLLSVLCIFSMSCFCFISKAPWCPAVWIRKWFVRHTCLLVAWGGHVTEP